MADTDTVTVTARDLNALSADALARGDRFTVALVAAARGEATEDQMDTLRQCGWGDAGRRACLAEAEELVRRAR